jgi:hypothetical protein
VHETGIHALKIVNSTDKLVDGTVFWDYTLCKPIFQNVYAIDSKDPLELALEYADVLFRLRLQLFSYQQMHRYKEHLHLRRLLCNDPFRCSSIEGYCRAMLSHSVGYQGKFQYSQWAHDARAVVERACALSGPRLKLYCHIPQREYSGCQESLQQSSHSESMQ